MTCPKFTTNKWWGQGRTWVLRAKSHVLSPTAQHEAASANVSPTSCTGCKLSRIFTRHFPQSSHGSLMLSQKTGKSPGLEFQLWHRPSGGLAKYFSLMHLNFVTFRSRIITVTREGSPYPSVLFHSHIWCREGFQYIYPC